MTRRRGLAIAVLSLLQSCADATHERFVEVAISLVTIQAEEGDPRCRQEPACGEAIAALRAVPPAHRDHAAAARLLAAIERARQLPDGGAVEAARREAAKLAPADPRAALPRDLPLPGAEEVPAFLQGGAGGRDGNAGDAGAAAGGAGGAEATPSGAGRAVAEVAEDFGGAPDGVEPSAHEEAGAFAAPNEDPDAIDPEVAAAMPEVSRGSLDARPCAKEQAEVERLRTALARKLADESGVAHVGDPVAHAGLELQRRIKRCADHPDDPGCAPPRTEVPLSELEEAGRAATRSPEELDAGGKAANETAHDPSLVRAERALRDCLAGAR